MADFLWGLATGTLFGIGITCLVVSYLDDRG